MWESFELKLKNEVRVDFVMENESRCLSVNSLVEDMKVESSVEVTDFHIDGNDI